MPNINQILKDDPRSCRYGAPMGDSGFQGEVTKPLHLQRLRFVDGDYDQSGTYWGGGGPEGMWCAFNQEGDGGAAGMAFRIYTRAPSRLQALVQFLELHPDIHFLRS